MFQKYVSVLAGDTDIIAPLSEGLVTVSTRALDSDEPERVNFFLVTAVVGWSVSYPNATTQYSVPAVIPE